MTQFTLAEVGLLAWRRGAKPAERTTDETPGDDPPWTSLWTPFAKWSSLAAAIPGEDGVVDRLEGDGSLAVRQPAVRYGSVAATGITCRSMGSPI